MKNCLLSILLIGSAFIANAQVSITANDMPVNGDTLRYSTTLATGFNINLNDTGANKVWSFDTLTPMLQRVDEYKSVLQVNPVYAAVITSLTAYGYKVADTLGLGSSPLPVSVTEVYTFFNKKTSPSSRFVAEGFGARISGTPVPAVYSNEDEWYFFPLNYGNDDTSDFYLKVQVPSVGSLVQQGDRYTKVDAWGTIKTPFFTTPQNCIRVRTEVVAVDSVQVSPLPAIGVPRRTVDYKWLIPGEHYPALWITTTITGSTETITAVRYRDSYRPASIQDAVKGNTISRLDIYPNPATDDIQIAIPGNISVYTVEVYDMQGRVLMLVKNENVINIAELVPGNYLVRLVYENGVGYAPLVKQ